MIPRKIIKLWLYKDELYSKIVTFGYLTYYNGETFQIKNWKKNLYTFCKKEVISKFFKI